MASGTAGPGVTGRLIGAWGDLGASAREIAAGTPGEGRLLFLAMLSGLFWFLGRLAELWIGGTGAGLAEDQLVARVAADFLGALVIRTLALYGLAGLCGLAARAAGGQGSWQDTRAAVFWAALVSAPVILVLMLVSAWATGQGLGAGGVGAVLSTLGNLVFAWAVAACLAAVHGFRSPWPAFLAIAGLGLTVTAAIALG